MLGAMQDWDLLVTHVIDHAARETPTREIVTHWANGSETRTDWAGIRRDALKMAQALEALGIRKGDRVASLAMNHSRHLVSWYGVAGMGGVLHTINPRLFEDQLEYIANHAEDRVLLYDAAFQPIVDKMRDRWTSIEHYICYDPPEGSEPLPRRFVEEPGPASLVRRPRVLSSCTSACGKGREGRVGRRGGRGDGLHREAPRLCPRAPAAARGSRPRAA